MSASLLQNVKKRSSGTVSRPSLEAQLTALNSRNGYCTYATTRSLRAELPRCVEAAATVAARSVVAADRQAVAVDAKLKTLVKARLLTSRNRRKHCRSVN